MNGPRKIKSALLGEVLNQITPDERACANQRMDMAFRINEAIKAKGLNKLQFAERMGQNPSVITKWLSGTHNFTMDTLTQIGRVLDINLFQVPAQPVIEVRYETRFVAVAIGTPNAYGRNRAAMNVQITGIQFQDALA